MVNAVMLGEGHLAVGSINGTGRGKHKVAQTCSSSAGFHQIHKPHEITVHVCEWILQGVTHTRLGRQIYNHFRFEVRDQTAEVSAITQVQLIKNESRGPRKLRQAGLLQIRIVIAVEIVYSKYLAVFIQQALRQMKADEARRPGNQNSHGLYPTRLGTDFNMFTVCNTGGAKFLGRCTEVISSGRKSKDSAAASEMPSCCRSVRRKTAKGPRMATCRSWSPESQ